MDDLSAAPTLAPAAVTCTPSATNDVAIDMPGNRPSSEVRFLEFFAGEGGLTRAVKAAGVEADDPEDLANGGLDFGKDVDLEGLKNYLHELHSNGVKLHLHFAPPCSTFSRARDRSWRTRLRSSERPQGLKGKGAQCRQANLIARNTLDVLEWAVRDLHAVASMENPESSYLWPFLDFDTDLTFSDVVFSPCMFGSDVRKPTRLRCWGWKPEALDKKCVLKQGVFSWA